uniref:Peptidase M13 N-terminal domain-containing protein n=1 Tax=Acrobeloides nanus TaxID=290746 RepID=A0A914CCU5_9BILA
MTTPTENERSPSSPKPEDGAENKPPPPIPEEPPPQLEEYDHEPRIAASPYRESGFNIYGLPPIDDEPIKEEEEAENWRPYSPYSKVYSESLSAPKTLHKGQKPTSLIKKSSDFLKFEDDSPESNGQENTSPPTIQARVVQILPHDMDEETESRQLTCRRAKCPFLLGMLLGLTILLCIGIFIAWAILSDGFQNMGGLSRVCSSKECIELASQLTESIDPSEKICNNFYRYSCGRFHASNPSIAGKTIDYMTKIRDLLENQLNEIFLNTSPGNANPFSLQFSTSLYQACTNPIRASLQALPLINLLRDLPSCTNPIRASLQALPLINLLRDLPCSPMLPFCSGFSSEYFSWERYVGMMDWYAGSYNLILYDRGPNPQAPSQVLLTFSAIDLSEILGPIKAHVSSLGPKEPTEFEALLSVEIKQRIIQDVQNLLGLDITDTSLLDTNELVEMIVELDNLSTWAKQTANAPPTIISLQEFSQLIDPIDLKSILDASISSIIKWSWSDPVVVNQVEYFRALPRLLSNFSKRTIANYLTIVTSLNLKKYLQFEIYDNSWRTCLKEMSALQPVAGVYAHSRTDLEFSRLFTFFNDLKKYFLTTNHQFEPNVVDTLHKLSIKIGVPKKVLDENYLASVFSTVIIEPEDYFISFIRAMKTQRASELGRIGTVVAPDDAINWPSLEPSLVYNIIENEIVIPIAIFQSPPLAIPLSNAPMSSILATTAVLFYQMMYRIARNAQPNGEPFNSIANCASNAFRQFVMPDVVNPNEFLTLSVEQLHSLELVRLYYRQWKANHQILREQTLPSFEKYSAEQLLLLQYGTLMCSTSGAIRGSAYEAMVNTVVSMNSDFASLFSCPRNSRMLTNVSCPSSKIRIPFKESSVEPFK